MVTPVLSVRKKPIQEDRGACSWLRSVVACPGGRSFPMVVCISEAVPGTGGGSEQSWGPISLRRMFESHNWTRRSLRHSPQSPDLGSTPETSFFNSCPHCVVLMLS